MRHWNGRPEPPAQFDVNRLRMIGEWGEASRYIGGRWEEVGLEQLRAGGSSGASDRAPLALLPVCTDPELSALLAATGSKNPDVVLIFGEEGNGANESLVLQPADLKWSLDVASYRQISASVLDTLLEQVPRLSAELRARLPTELAETHWSTRDGYFFCPNSYANQRFIASTENKKQEYPLGPTDVRFASVDPFDFFEPLPGWKTGRELARIDGSTRGLNQLDTADRYYHLGAGVAGALLALEGSIFDEPVEVEPEKEIERFRGYLKTINPPTTAVVIDRLGVQMRHRRDLIRRLRDLTRVTFTFREFADQLVKAGLAQEGEGEAVLRRRFGETYRSLLDAEEEKIVQAGRAMHAKGATDGQAIEALVQQQDTFARHLRLQARQAIQVLLESQAASTVSVETTADPR
ncbi:MAG TPA: hypothetical protein VKX96_05500 [Chloroflexota bacterium]|nr:hypothetical protein [Chloroflexota bacterium]